MAPFYPKLVCLQIVAMQAWFYVVMALLLGFVHGLFGVALSLDSIFASQGVSVRTGAGWTAIMMNLLSALFGCLLLALIVEKSKKCLDFAATLYILHFFAVWSYDRHVPTNWQWWVLQVICLVVMTALGEFICSRRELRDIPLFSPVPQDAS